MGRMVVEASRVGAGTAKSYRALDGTLMATSVLEGPTGLEFGTPSALFRISEPQGIVCYL